MELKILTFNIWDIPAWFCVNREGRIARLPDFLKKHDPDIICLQESFDTKNRALIHKTLGKSLYKIQDNWQKTRRILLYKKFDKSGGLVTFSKFKIQKTVFTPFKKHPLMSLWERFGAKGFLETLIKTPYGPLLVINVHFLNGKNKIPKKIRMMQVSSLFERLKSENGTTIIAGDFNEEAHEGEDNFHHIFQKLGFSDSARFLKKVQRPTLSIDNPYTTILFQIRAGGISERYDHVLVKNGLPAGRQGGSLTLEVKDVRTLNQPKNPLSDHEPVLATFKISRKFDHQ